MIAQFAKLACTGPLPAAEIDGHRRTFAADAPATVRAAADGAAGDLILDIGPQTAALLAEQLKAAGTIVWNGPVGVFEFDAIAHALPAFEILQRRAAQ